MSRNRDTVHVVPTGPWVTDTRELGHRAGASRRYSRTLPAPARLGLDMIGIPAGDPVEVDLLLESVVEGVLVSGTAVATTSGECARCLEEISERVEVELRELFAYPDSATDTSTDDDEVGRVVEERIDLEPMVRDAMLLALPSAPLCSPDCQGLCAECGVKWAELESDHTHETMDPRWAALRERFGGIEEGN